MGFTFRILHVKHPVLTFGLLALSRLTGEIRVSLELADDSLLRAVALAAAGARRNGIIWIFGALISRILVGGCVKRSREIS